jgi:putative lipoic acid-binding regulatory protein
MTQRPDQSEQAAGTPDAPRIEFPCQYPIKIMGRHEDGFTACIVDVIERHDPGFSRETIVWRESSGGRYLSVTVTITATGTDQLKSLFEDLKATGRVAMVL